MVGAGGRRRPDITAIDIHGKVHAIELASMSDMKNQATFDCLFDRNDESMKKMDSILGVQRRGEIISIPHSYNAKSIKIQLDNLIKSIK